MAGFFTPSLLIDRNIMLDAGSFGSILSLRQQLEIDHFLISHAHCDHVKDLACFADLVIGRRRAPVRVHASPGAMEVIRGDIFNNRMWPDFFSLPSPEHPVLKAAVFKPGKPFRVGHLRVRAIPVSHPVESMAFIIRGQGGAFVYTGDTGPTERLWKSVNGLKDLRLLMIECKFPNDMQVIADAAGHFTPRTLVRELAKVRNDSVPVLLYHLKPDRIEEILQEISSLADSRIRIMKIGERIRV
ncbi:MAG TPA: 3',5'-cyclic-nucleotide phosphodiesterase [Myxococcota bacterium]|nr:3',5'-cyclic-nucleotide phosphodiesterase [Myxococcota bacterium]